MTTKVIKIEINNPINMKWDVLSNILYKIKKETQIIMNKTIQLCWEYNNFATGYKEKNGCFPSEKEALGKTLTGYIYDRLKVNTLLYTANSSQSQQRAIKKWKSDIKEVFLGNRTIASYKKDTPIDLHNKSIEITKPQNKYVASLSLLNRKGAKEYGLSSSKVDVALIVKDKFTKTIIERVMSGQYKIGASQLMKHKTKNKWFLNLTYSFEPKQSSNLDKNNIMGIDMGICNPIYIAYNNSLNRFAIEGDEITSFRNRVYERRNAYLKQGKYCGEGRVGHGRATRLKPIEKLQGKVENFKNTINHKYSKKVIDLAIKNNCGVIQMEDLSGIASNEKKASFLGNWTYYDLQLKIENKAKEAGIEVRKVKPNYTSQRCSKCGFIDKENRPQQNKFKCVNCDYETHADYNAARNISTQDIEKIIVEQLKSQDKAYSHSLKYVM